MLLLSLVMQRRRHYLERIAFEGKTRRELERRVMERTSDLEGLNSRLRQEVLEREQAQQRPIAARTRDKQNPRAVRPVSYKQQTQPTKNNKFKNRWEPYN